MGLSPPAGCLCWVPVRIYSGSRTTSWALWSVTFLGLNGLVAAKVPPMGVTISERGEKCVSWNLEKDSESYPNPRRKPFHFQHFAILINACCENLVEVRVTGII